MSDRTHELIERIADLTAQNTELMGILLYVVEDAPKEKPTLANIWKTLNQARKFWAVGQTVKISLEWIASDLTKGKP